MTPQIKYASLPRYSYWVPSLQYSCQPQIPQVKLEPPKPPEPEPEHLPTIDIGGPDPPAADETAKIPVPATVEDAPDADAGLY